MSWFKGFWMALAGSIPRREPEINVFARGFNWLDHLVAELGKRFGEEGREFILTHDQAELHLVQHRWGGQAFRNEYELWDRNTPAVQWFIREYGICHADDISGMVYAALWAKVRGKCFFPHTHAGKYKEYWRKQGIDPKTMERLPCDVGGGI